MSCLADIVFAIVANVLLLSSMLCLLLLLLQLSKEERFDKLSKRGQQLAATSCGSFCFKSWCCLFVLLFVVSFDCCYCQNCTVWELTVGLLSKRGKQLAATTCGGKGKWGFHPGNTCPRQLTTGSTKKKQGNTKGKIQEIQNEIQEIEKSNQGTPCAWQLTTRRGPGKIKEDYILKSTQKSTIWYELVRTQLVLLKAKEIVDRNNQHFAFFESRFGIPWYARTPKKWKDLGLLLSLKTIDNLVLRECKLRAFWCFCKSTTEWLISPLCCSMNMNINRHTSLSIQHQHHHCQKKSLLNISF